MSIQWLAHRILFANHISIYSCGRGTRITCDVRWNTIAFDVFGIFDDYGRIEDLVGRQPQLDVATLMRSYTLRTNLNSDRINKYSTGVPKNVKAIRQAVSATEDPANRQTAFSADRAASLNAGLTPGKPVG